MKIAMTRDYPHPPEAVWHALTDARAIRQWWVDTDFAPEVGRRFFLQDTPQGGWDGRVTGEVLEVVPGKAIRFSWSGGGHATTVTYRLEPLPDGGTRFTLLHDGFRGVGGLVLRLMLRSGWGSFVNELLPRMAAHVATHGMEAPFPTPGKAERAA